MHCNALSAELAAGSPAHTIGSSPPERSESQCVTSLCQQTQSKALFCGIFIMFYFPSKWRTWNLLRMLTIKKILIYMNRWRVQDTTFSSSKHTQFYRAIEFAPQKGPTSINWSSHRKRFQRRMFSRSHHKISFYRWNQNSFSALSLGDTRTKFKKPRNWHTLNNDDTALWSKSEYKVGKYLWN